MALPKINTPFYELTLPSSGETVKYRPFLVKEEKILLMAMEGGKQKEISNALRQIITNCTDGAVQVDKIPMFDVVYIFLQLRIKSVEDVANVNLKCGKCGAGEVAAKIDLTKVQVEFTEEKQEFKVQLTSDIGLTLKYPTLDMVGTDEDLETAEQMFDLICRCVESIYDEEQVYNDFSQKEVNEFLEELPQEHFKKISTFFENMPKLKHTVKFTCPDCKKKNSYTLSGLQDFFESASLTTT